MVTMDAPAVEIPARSACSAPVFCFQDLRDILRLQKTAAHTDQGTGDDPDHIIEKAVSPDPEGDHIVLPFQIQ